MFWLLFLLGSRLASGEVYTLQFLSEQILKKETQIKALPIGGLSSLKLDPKTGELVALSDAKTSPRIYRFTLERTPKPHLKLKSQTTLKGFKKLGQKIDPEAIEIQDETLLIASEGQQVFFPNHPTTLFSFSKKGALQSIWPHPPAVWDPKRKTTFGVVANKGFESVTLDKEKPWIWTATERPLKQDQKGWIRIIALDLKTKKVQVQFAYPIKEKKVAFGLVEMLFIKDQTFFTLERAYETYWNGKEKKSGKNHARLFVADCSKATPIQGIKGIDPKNLTPCKKNPGFQLQLPLAPSSD